MESTSFELLSQSETKGLGLGSRLDRLERVIIPQLVQENQELKRENQELKQKIEFLSNKPRDYVFDYSSGEIDTSKFTKDVSVPVFSIKTPSSGNYILEWSFFSFTISPHLWFYWGLKIGTQTFSTINYQHSGLWHPITGRLVVCLNQNDTVSITLYNNSAYPNSKAKDFFLKLTKIS